MKSITPAFAEILGLLCAEGSYILSFPSYWGKDRQKLRYYKDHKSERIELYNKDKKLLSHYQELLKIEFNYEPKITKHGKVNICKILIIKFILGHVRLGHQNWYVPQSILKGNDKLKISFLRGYFDGDGTSSTTIRFFSTNERGLKEVSELLSSLDFKHTFPKPQIKSGRKPLYSIQLSRSERERFLTLIKPVSKYPGMRGLPNKSFFSDLRAKLGQMCRT